MKELIQNADGFLAQMTVSGANVMLLAAARSALLQAYQQLDDAARQKESEGEHGDD